MKEDAAKGPANPSERELALLETLRANPRLLDHIEELAMMTRDPEDLGKDGHQAESKVVELCRGIGKGALQGWANAANQSCERAAEKGRAKGQSRHGKKNSTG